MMECRILREASKTKKQDHNPGLQERKLLPVQGSAWLEYHAPSRQIRNQAKVAGSLHDEKGAPDPSIKRKRVRGGSTDRQPRKNTKRLYK